MEQNYPEIAPIGSHYHFSGVTKTSLVTDAAGLVKILMVLPGQKAATFRSACAPIIVRYLGGDETLCEEVRSNARMQQQLPEDHPLRIFGKDVESKKRQRENDDDPEQLAEKRARFQIELEQHQLELRAKKLELDEKQMAMELELKQRTQELPLRLRMMQVELQNSMVASTKQLVELGHSFLGLGSDVRFKEAVIGQVFTHILDKPYDTKERLRQFKTIGQLVEDVCGRRRALDLTLVSNIGRLVSREYEKKKGEKPEKTAENVNGGMRNINVYHQDDWEWIEELIDEYRAMSAPAAGEPQRSDRTLIDFFVKQ